MMCLCGLAINLCSKLFRNTAVFKSLDPHYYQCSRRTTSIEIETVFQHAINRQRSHKKFSMPIHCGKFEYSSSSIIAHILYLNLLTAEMNNCVTSLNHNTYMLGSLPCGCS